MFSNTFNTTQFIDVSTDRQRAAGTTVFQDLQNPGDYYMETASGHVYRTNKQTVISQTNNLLFDVDHQTTQYCINLRNRYQGKNKPMGYTLILDRNRRLARIQYISNKRNRLNNTRTISSTSTNNDGIVTTSKYFPG